MDKKLLQFPCELTEYKSYATKRSIKICFETQEDILPDHLSTLLACKNMTGWLVFSPTDNQVRPQDIPELPVEPKSGKTPTERLYNTLFVLFKHLQDEKRIAKDANFNRWREDYMERIIDGVKTYLPNRNE